jgi:class 3 adenylate cyclase/predicted ATPase
VICPTCSTENAATAKFCIECATPLHPGCPTCGTQNPPGAKFCAECATPLAPAAARAATLAQPSATRTRAPSPAATPVAERRLVSVLFADLVGFTPFAEERDPEEVRETLSRYFETAREVIGRYGGTVEKFIGDAVMAVWGAPVAREDDAERAVRAGLELVDAVRSLGPTIHARVGILTGEAAVTLGATHEGMVAGDLVNTAARLQSVASPGSVIVGEPTMRAASAAIAFESAGEQTLKGKAAPVEAFRALRIVAQRGGHGRSDLPEPPFVGRDDELRLLKDLVTATGRDRRTRLVSITGPGGIGKSRLAWELEKYIDGITETVYWHRGRSPAYGDGITFWALGEMVRRRAGLAETDDETTTRERTTATVAEFVPEADDRAWVEPALLTLLGLEPAPAGGRDVLFAAWRILFERIAERGTTVLVFEDLQWADSGLLDFIDHLLDWSRGVPILIVTLARPDLFERRPDWGAGRRSLTALALEPLTDGQMRELLAGFIPGLPADAATRIIERAGGIPLYAVETVRALLTDGRLELIDGAYRPVGELEDLAIPDTLRSLIAARLDALDPVDRSLVQDASVLGQAFTLAGLTAVSGTSAEELATRLRGLVRRELLELEADPHSPERGQYRFVQSLIREVAYSTLARRERRARHLAAARYFEALDDAELAGALANHYLAALEATAEGPEREASAVQAQRALRGAAERAASLGAYDQAVAYLRDAIGITDEPGARATLYLLAARYANTAARHTDAEALARAGIELAGTIGDVPAPGMGEALLGEILIEDGRPPEALAVLEAAVARLPEGADAETRAELLGNLSRAYMRTYRTEAAIETADRALDVAEHAHLDRIIAETFDNKGASLGNLGRGLEGLALLRAAVEIAHQRGFVAAEIRALSNLAGAADDLPTSREAARTALDLARRVGNRSQANWAASTYRWLLVWEARGWDEVVVESGEELEEIRAAGTASPLDEVRILMVQGMVRVPRGEPVDDLLADLERLTGRTTDAFATNSLHAIRGERALVRGEYARACEELTSGADDPNMGQAMLASAIRAALWWGERQRALELAARLDAHPFSDPGTTAARLGARAGIAALEGRRQEAIAGFTEAVGRFRAIGADLFAAQAGLDLVVLVGPDEPAARAAAAESRAIFERVGARAYLDRLDAALAGGPREATSAPSVTRPPSPTDA